MRVLIIGGAGLLGSYLAPMMEEKGHEVALFDNFTGSIRYRTSNKYRVFTANITDYNASLHSFEVFNPEIVVFAAAHHFSRDTIYRFYDDVKITTGGAFTLSACLDSNVKHVYFCSGYEVYGGPQTNRALKENRKVVRPATHHGSAEWAAEQLLEFRCYELSIPFTSLRIFDLYGPRIVFCPRSGVVSFLIDSFLRNETVGLVGANRKRDFIHAEDAARAIVGIIASGYEGVVNVGTGVGTTLKDLSRKLLGHLDVSEKPVLVDSRVGQYSSIADTKLLTSSDVFPGWEPEHCLEEDLGELVAFRKKEIDFTANQNPLRVLNAMRGIESV